MCFSFEVDDVFTHCRSCGCRNSGRWTGIVRRGFVVVLGGAVFMGLAWCSLAAAQSESTVPPASAVANTGNTEVAINVGRQKQLFIDESLFAESKNITLRMNPPVKMGPALLADRPWEQEIGFCVSIIEDGGLYKMWYLAENWKRPYINKYFLSYATSKDGIVWEKPSLGLVACNGSKDNNIVMTSGIEKMVFLDPAGPPEARFKAIIHTLTLPKTGGLYVHTSPDGIYWNSFGQRVFPLGADTANQAFYDSRLKKYVAYIRVWVPPYDVEGGGEWPGLRKIGRVEMDDITKPWPMKQLDKPYHPWGDDRLPAATYQVPHVFGYDEHDPPNSDHYNPAIVQYPWADRAYFLFPSAYRHSTELVDIQMAASRDGVKWTRLSREPYVALGTQDEFDFGSLYMAAGMVRCKGKIFQYYGGYRLPHSSKAVDPKPGEPISHIFRLEQRLDGFVSADAAYEGGEFTTPPLVFSGTQLVLNLNASAMGACKVEILDDQRHAIPGYSLGDCVELSGNHLEKTVTWRSKSDLRWLTGRAVRLRFVMRSCKLFSFQFP